MLTPDELKSLPKGDFIVMKTGTHPMRTRLQLCLNWGITFGEPYGYTSCCSSNGALSLTMNTLTPYPTKAEYKMESV